MHFGVVLNELYPFSRVRTSIHCEVLVIFVGILYKYHTRVKVGCNHIRWSENCLTTSKLNTKSSSFS